MRHSSLHIHQGGLATSGHPLATSKRKWVLRVLLRSLALKGFRAAAGRPYGDRHGVCGVRFQLFVRSLRATVVFARVCHGVPVSICLVSLG